MNLNNKTIQKKSLYIQFYVSGKISIMKQKKQLNNKNDPNTQFFSLKGFIKINFKKKNMFIRKCSNKLFKNQTVFTFYPFLFNINISRWTSFYNFRSKKIEQTENEIFETIKERKIQKKIQAKKLKSTHEESDSDTDKTFEEFFSSDDESSDEILQESSDESENS